jgi:hypothetical protein
LPWTIAPRSTIVATEWGYHVKLTSTVFKKTHRSKQQSQTPRNHFCSTSDSFQAYHMWSIGLPAMDGSSLIWRILNASHSLLWTKINRTLEWGCTSWVGTMIVVQVSNSMWNLSHPHIFIIIKSSHKCSILLLFLDSHTILLSDFDTK